MKLRSDVVNYTTPSLRYFITKKIKNEINYIINKIQSL
jgi:hypothetical protein